MSELQNENSLTPDTRSHTPFLVGFLAVGIFLVALTFFYAVFSVLQQQGDSASTSFALEYQGTLYDPPAQISNFTLPSSKGVDMSLSDFSGRYVLMFFGYTHCPDVCPTTLADFKQIKTRLGEQVDQVDFLFISFDTPRDTPQVLNTYLSHFDTGFIGLSGDDTALEQIAPEFGLYYMRLPDLGTEDFYPVDHSGRTFLLNPDGELVMSFSYGTDTETIASAIQSLMTAS